MLYIPLVKRHPPSNLILIKDDLTSESSSAVNANSQESVSSSEVAITPTTTDFSLNILGNTATATSSAISSSITSTIDETLYPAIQIATSTTSPSTTISSTSDDDQVTVVYTQVTADGTKTPSIQLIIPTITTNTLPTGYSLVGGSNSTSTTLNNSSASLSLYYNSYSFLSSKSSIFTKPVGISSSVFKSTLILPSSMPVSTYADPGISSTRSKTISSSKSPSIAFGLTTGTSTFSSFSSSSISSQHLKSTTTVTEYLEQLTYTQVYVVTGSWTTITTSLCATTSFYIDSLSSTYSISPPAITTDFAALKTRHDFDFIFKKKLSGGAIAGISIGSTFGFFFLILFFWFFLRRKRKNITLGNIFTNHFTKDTELANYDGYSSTYVRDLDSHGDNDHADDDYGAKQSNNNNLNDINQVINSANLQICTPENYTPSNFELQSPPVPNRSNKPIIFESSPSPVDDNPNDFDMSLFDMKSTLNAINASTEVNQHLMPPIPPARKSKSSNRIDKMNYTVDKATPSPTLLIDRTMSVLYESPNEQCIWDEFDGAKDAGAMVDIPSPIDSLFNSFDFENFDDKSNHKLHYAQQLNSFAENDDSFRDSILRHSRVRSGSGAKRYEYLANNVETFKNELQKDRISSLQSGTSDTYDISYAATNNATGGTERRSAPPPIPKPRKNKIDL